MCFGWRLVLLGGSEAISVLNRQYTLQGIAGPSEGRTLP
jgi:hypothetical protein